MENFLIVFVVLIIVIIAGLVAAVFLSQIEPVEPLSCLENNGYLCAEDKCAGEIIPASDGLCCSQECTEPPAKKTCSDLGGRKCTENQKCSKELLITGDTEKCCTGNCEDVTVLKTCYDLGGEVCLDFSECRGTILTDASDTDFCCNKKCEDIKILKTCSDVGGEICSNASECNGEIINTSDTNLCCNKKCQKSLFTCSQQSGFICTDKNQCTGSLFNASDTNLCCSTQCLPPKSIGLSNNNKICEGGESDFSSDCKCPGTICGGVCHYGEGVCCGDTYIVKEKNKEIYCTADKSPVDQLCYSPGTCQTSYPLKIHFDFPTNLELNKEYTGKIELTNTGSEQTDVSLNLIKNSVDVKENGQPITSLAFNIAPGEKKIKEIKIIPTKLLEDNFAFVNNPYILFTPWIRSSSSKPNVKSSSFSSTVYKYEFFVYDTNKFTQCGNYRFSEKGFCKDSYYFDWNCPKQNELTYNKCSNGIPAFFDYSIYNANQYESYGYVKLKGDSKTAKGLVKVSFIPVGTDINSVEIATLRDNVEAFYDRESNKILGKNMVDFEFKLASKIIFDYNSVQTQDEFFSSIVSTSNLQNGSYDFVVAVVNKTEAQKFLGNNSGHYLWKGRILQSIDVLNPFTTAHEIAHGFGAPDLYFNGTHVVACKFNFDSTCLMCSEQRYGFVQASLDTKNLCEAGFLGWGDIDNDGIVDIDDPYIDTSPNPLPSWFTGISLEIVNVSISDKQNVKYADYIVQVKDNLGNIINQDLNVTYRLTANPSKCSKTLFNSNIAYSCSFGSQSTQQLNVTIRADFLGKFDEKTTIFVP